MAKTGKIIEELTRESVVAHLDNGDSLKGVLLATYSDCLVLAHAVALTDGGEMPVDGEAVLPLRRILWVQRLDAEGFR